MPVVKLSQYPKYSLPQSLKGQISELNPNFSQFELHERNQPNVLLCTLQLDSKLIAYSEVDLEAPEATLIHIAVRPEYQGRGLGTILLTHTLKKLGSIGSKRLQAQCEPAIRGFFERFGFIATDDDFQQQRSRTNAVAPVISLLLPSIELAIKHLPAKALTNGHIPKNLFQLGHDSNSYLFSSETEYLDLHKQMLNQARKRIWLLCDTIQNPLLNNEDTAKAIQKLVRRNPQSEVRILVATDKIGAGYHNPTVGLAHRLSSYVEVRTLQNSGVRMKEMITLVDFNASVFRKSLADANGFACFYNRMLYERMRENFEQHWQFAKPSQQLRRLAI